MPSSDKDRRSGRLGRLLAALPVQTGFPTSLADLVVKNHGRLKKQPSPSSKRRKGGVSASPSPSPPPRPALAAAAVSLSSDRPRPDLSPAQGVRREKSGAVGLGLGFVAVSGVASLAVLVIWSKKVVAAVTVASFSLFLLESLRGSSRQRPAAGATERQHLYLDGRGRVSPIREAEAETELSRSDSDTGIEEVSSILSAEEKSGGLDESSSTTKGKPKRRAWKKLVASAKKLHKRGRKSKEEEDRSVSSLRGEGDSADATVRGSVEDVVAGYLGPGRSRSSEIHVDAPADLILTTEVAAAEEQGVEAVGSRFPAPVLVAVVLVGLVAGKLPALALTVLCAAFFGSVGSRGKTLVN
jgi:hypothetical protein